MSSSVPSIPVARQREDSPGRRARRRWNAAAAEINSLPRTIAHLERQMQAALDAGNRVLAQSIAARIESLRLRLKKAQAAS